MQINALIGKKTYQKQGFLQDGRRVPLSGVLVLGNVITQIKSENKEGYNALQLGIGIKKKARKSLENHSKKAGLKNTPRFFKEIKVDSVEEAVAGVEINISEVFQPGDMVDVTGISKGKGFAGGVKRHGFHGGPKTHGQSDRHRAPGSIGQGTTPGRVYKGKRMAGRMGQDTVTIKNLEVIEITNDGVLLIKGLVPGSLNSVLVVKRVGENKKFVPLYKEEEIKEEVAKIEPTEEVSEAPKEEITEEAKVSDRASGGEMQVEQEQSAKEVKVEASEVQSEEVKKEENKEETKEEAPLQQVSAEQVKEEDGNS